jgi:hypothetical protein
MLLKQKSAFRSQDWARDRLFDHYADLICVNHILTRSLVSFQGNKKQAFSRWLRYKEAFSCEFVNFIFDRVDVEKSEEKNFFDPFAGSGTALFVAAERGWNAGGTELLPVGAAVIKARIAANNVDLTQLANIVDTLDRIFAARGNGYEFPHLKITQGAFPAINEGDIASYRAFVRKLDDRSLKTLLDFAGLCVLEDVSFTRKDGQYLRWDKRSGRKVTSSLHKGEIPRFRFAIKKKLEDIVSDIRVQGQRDATGRISIAQESFLLHGIKNKNHTADFVITSPPYCNRYDYTRTYALELAYLGYNENDVRKLRQSLLSATVENRPKIDTLRDLFTSCNQANRFVSISEAFQSADALHEVISILEEAADAGELNNSHIPRMIRNYFFEMAVAVSHLSSLVRKRGLVVMVNDNVRYFGEEVPVDLVLASFAEAFGFDVEAIWVLPKGKGNSSQQMGAHGRTELRKCVYIWRKR